MRLGVHPVAVVGKIVKKKERDSYIQKEMQCTKQHKDIDTQNWKQTNKTRKQTYKEY
jgi:uncharacterized protein YdeI (BOF family)